MKLIIKKKPKNIYILKQSLFCLYFINVKAFLVASVQCIEE